MILGVLSDTHIPDRVRMLNPRVFSVFREAGVSAILHAGDICSPDVLARLGEIAPVSAVRGNRDWVFLPKLPLRLTLTFEGVTVGLTHGHGSAWEYWAGKAYWILRGYRLERYWPRLQTNFPQAQVIVFGHTHRPVNLRDAGKLLFNPGSTCCPEETKIAPSIGLLTLAGGDASGEIVYLD